MKRILITGGAGFIGSHCVDRFLNAGYEVGVFDIKTTAQAVHLTPVLNEITYHSGDIRHKDELDAVMGDYDTVLHLAAIVSVQESIADPIGTHATNVTGTLNVLASAHEHAIKKVVYASSAAVYGDTAVVPTPEATALAPLSPYGVHKLMNEAYARLYTEQYALPTTGLRFFNVYGSRQDPTSPYSGVISIFAEKIQAKEHPTIFGDGTATRDFIHVSDVAAACQAAIEATVTEPLVLNIGSGSEVSINELVQACNQAFGATLEPNYAEMREGDIKKSCAATERAHQLIAFAVSIDLAQGLSEMMRAEDQQR